ncbi:unnamed protein product [Lactuca saligna]|uniref:Uncharacterized protein n=1 Tax=Lactuca saligna TaxID=75948 RepID=A0AA36E7E2_LACSI|nr:unnamed protein product [Lactuca saligna]
MVENIEKQQVERLKIHDDKFEYEVKKLCDVAKERHEILVEQVKAIKESLDLKMTNLKAEIAKEVEKLEKLDAKTESYSKVFEKFEEFLSNIKETISQAALSNQSSVSQEAITQMISSIEANLKKELAPLLEVVLLPPTNAPPTKQVSQGGEKGCGDVGSSKDLIRVQLLEG